jgi:hypothetical protein
MGYDTLRPVISVWICDQNVVDTPPSHDAWHTTWEIRERSTHAVWCRDFELHVIELDRVRRSQAAIGPWLRFLAEAEAWGDVPAEVNSPLMEKAMNVLDRFRHNDHARAIYEARMNEERQRIANEALLRKATEEKEQERQARAVAEQARDAEARAREAAEQAREAAERKTDRLAARLRAAGIDPDLQD